MKYLILLIYFIPSILHAAKFSLVENQGNQLLQGEVEFRNIDPRELTHKFGPSPKSYRWVAVNESPKPPYDPYTQKLIRTDLILPDEHRITYARAPLTGTELAEAQRKKRHEQIRQTLQAIALKMAPVAAGGQGLEFDQLSAQERTRLLVGILLDLNLDR